MKDRDNTELLRLAAAHHGQIVQLQSFARAIFLAVLDVGEKQGLDRKVLRKSIEDRIDQEVQQRLEELEAKDPELAAFADIRKVPGLTL